MAMDFIEMASETQYLGEHIRDMFKREFGEQFETIMNSCTIEALQGSTQERIHNTIRLVSGDLAGCSCDFNRPTILANLKEGKVEDFSALPDWLYTLLEEEVERRAAE